MLIYEECSTQESIRGGGHPYCLVQLQLLRVCRGFWKPRYGNISQELIQVIAISIVTPGSYPRNGGLSKKKTLVLAKRSAGHSETVAVPASALSQAGVSELPKGMCGNIPARRCVTTQGGWPSDS